MRLAGVLFLGRAERARHIPEVELDFARDLESIAKIAIMNNKIFRLAVIPGTWILPKRFAAEITDFFVRKLFPA